MSFLYGGSKNVWTALKHIRKKIYENTKIKRNEKYFFPLLKIQWRWVWFLHLFTSLNNLPEKKDKKNRNKMHLSFVSSKSSIDKLLERNNTNHSIMQIYWHLSAH